MGRFKWALVLAVILVIPCISFAVPQLINYQGKLSDGSGNPVSGVYSIIFTIYNAPTGGDVLWTETQTVTVTDGVFNVLLGSQSSLSVNIFGGDESYLGVKVDTDAEMTPRQQLASVPYALTAGCIPGDEVVCYTGDPATRGIGECATGERTCGPDGSFGACVGEVTPVTEICDDGFDSDCDGQTNNGCIHYIFVTSGGYEGTFGGLSAGDSICQSHGDSGSFTAGLGATWTAILSDAFTIAKDRFTLQGPVFNTNGDLLANDSADLWDGTLASPVGYAENGGSVSDFVWTGTLSNGAPAFGGNCNDWSNLTDNGLVGNTSSTDGSWVASGIEGCFSSFHLYCMSSSVMP